MLSEYARQKHVEELLRLGNERFGYQETIKILVKEYIELTENQIDTHEVIEAAKNREFKGVRDIMDNSLK